jgi:hypothetical protein
MFYLYDVLRKAKLKAIWLRSYRLCKEKGTCIEAAMARSQQFTTRKLYIIPHPNKIRKKSLEAIFSNRRITPWLISLKFRSNNYRFFIHGILLPATTIDID